MEKIESNKSAAVQWGAIYVVGMICFARLGAAGEDATASGAPTDARQGLFMLRPESSDMSPQSKSAKKTLPKCERVCSVSG